MSVTVVSYRCRRCHTGDFGHSRGNWTWQIDTRTGTVEYGQSGERKFVDEGDAVVFDIAPADRDALLAGMLLAREKSVVGAPVSSAESRKI